MSTIAENIAAIRARIDAAARTTGRTGADIPWMEGYAELER